MTLSAAGRREISETLDLSISQAEAAFAKINPADAPVFVCYSAGAEMALILVGDVFRFSSILHAWTHTEARAKEVATTWNAALTGENVRLTVEVMTEAAALWTHIERVRSLRAELLGDA